MELLALVYVALGIILSPNSNASAHRNLIGEVEEVDFSSEIHHIEFSTVSNNR